ncbi:MAG: LAGLIDADG family homing endonuclease [Promethearchaeota archaeon]
MTTPLSAPAAPLNRVQKFEDFYRFFEERPGVYTYQDQINNIFSKGGNTLVFLYEDLLSFDSQLADLLKDDPEALIEDAIEAFKNLLKFQAGTLLKREYFVRISTKDDNSPLFIPIRSLRAKYIDKLVWFKGILIRSSIIRPKITKAKFECSLCSTQFEIQQLSSRIKLPKFCINKKCKAKAQSDFRLISKDSEFIDWQSISIQEVPEDLPAGRIPRSVQCILTHDLVDSAKPGDRVKVMGIYKSVMSSSSKSFNSTLFTTYHNINYIEPEDKTDDDLELSREDKEQIEKLSKEPMIQKKIARSLAPDIYGREPLKMAAALSLFGGTRKKKRVGGWKRGDIHVLFVGDPGTGKSVILKSAVEISPRGLYTSGKGASAVGLTAAVIKEPDTGQMNLEAGAIVLANGGIAAIDEFDKMDTADRSALHEAMEQQSYHYDTEILSTDGRRFLIGEFIDELFENNFDAVIHGIDCEILPYKDLGLFSTDFKEIFKIHTNRVSRHRAPKEFYEFTFTNGRKIKVTPEHPMFVFREGKLICLEAQGCQENDFIPIPQYLPNSNIPIELSISLEEPHKYVKAINFPRVLTSDLSRILGYLASEGHSYLGSSAEISFSNKESLLLDDMKVLVLNTFGIEPSINWREDGLITLRFISIELFKWMKINFSEVMRSSKFKRIPSKILSSDIRICQSFLKSAFKGDGSVESTAIYYGTVSKGLSYDYQDLLLKLGIQSRIVHDKHNDLYKVYIRGHSLIDFYKKIVEEDDIRFNKIFNLIKSNKNKTHHHDIFPTSVINNILDLKIDLAVSNNGYYYRHLEKNQGLTRERFHHELKKLNKKYKVILKAVNKLEDIKQFREITGFSQNEIARICNLYRYNIDYYERGVYDKKKREALITQIRSSFKKHFKNVKKRILKLEQLYKSEILWDRIKNVKRIQNSGENKTKWVYDLTVEPNHTFISQGVILHNTVSIAKAGIVATLRAETAVIAAANPHSGRYDTYKTPTQNIRLPPSLLSRFDLIFVVIDKPNPAEDAQLAEFILQNAMDDASDSSEDPEKKSVPIPKDLLTKYIKYARKNCFPSLSVEAKERIKEFYLELRGDYNGDDAVVSILARNLDALVRLCEAYAKMALESKVTKEHAEEIIKLFKIYLKDTGYDAATGKIDMDRIFVGQSRSQLNKLDKLLNRLKEMFEENGWRPLEKDSVIQIIDIDEEDLEKKFIKDAIEELIREGTLYEPKPNHIKFTQREE